MPDMSPPRVLAALTAADAARLRAAHRAYADAQRAAELAAARAKVALGEAHEALLAVERELAAVHGYDADTPARLQGAVLVAIEEAAS